MKTSDGISILWRKFKAPEDADEIDLNPREAAFAFKRRILMWSKEEIMVIFINSYL